MTLFTLALTALTVGADPVPAAPPPVPADPAQVRQAITRSLTYLDEHRSDYGCISCHDGPWMIWSFHEAAKRGINVNRKSLDLIQSRAVKNYGGHADLKPAAMDGFRQLSTNVLYLSPAFLATGNIDPATNALLDRISAHLVKNQKEDGHWVINTMGHLKPDQTYYYILNDKGEEYVPPLIDENDVTTLWAVLALTGREHTGPLKDEVARSRDKALKWLKENRASDNLQGSMLRVLLAKRLGTAEEVQAALQRVLDQRNPDGGWGQTKDLASDATGTGQALVALTNAGLTAKDPVIAKAWTFLLNSQSANGSWPVFERAKFRKNPKAKDEKKPKESSSYIGTAWTVIGLARSLPPEANEAAAQR
jgi:hypothetical protein